MEITIKSAAEMAKVSRNTIYQAIKDGKLSRSESGKVESSEVLRVFGYPAERHTRQEEREHIEQLKNTQNTEQNREQSLNTFNTLSSDKEELYKSQIKGLQDALQEAREREKQHFEREQWQRQHIEKLTDTIKLLEAPKEKVGFWRGLFGK